MVTLQSAENALKTVYLGTISDLLNTRVNPLLAKFEQTSVNVSGKEIRMAVRTSIDGGIGAGDETGELPRANGTNYLQFVITLKNLYGQIEISDKSIRAGGDTKGAFTNLLNQSLDGLLESSRYNLSRMLYGNGTGELGEFRQSNPNNYSEFEFVNNYSNINNVQEGMIVDWYDEMNDVTPHKRGLRIKTIDRYAAKPFLVLEGVTEKATDFPHLYLQGSRDKEITGLKAIFETFRPLYGLDRKEHKILLPYVDNTKKKVSDLVFSNVVDTIENITSSTVDFIAVAQNVKLAYQNYLSTFKRNVDIMELKGGYKSISFNGIPVVSERFVDNNQAYFLDTTAFKLHQLCDWQFIENENGRVLRQTQGKPTYSATLVKYCDLVCSRPNGQGKLLLDATIS